MKLKMYSIFDKKAATFLAPFYQHNDQVAIRSFTASIRDPQSSFCRFPADFALYRVGEFDDASAVIETHLPVEFVVEALDLVMQPDQDGLFPTPQLRKVADNG